MDALHISSQPMADFGRLGDLGSIPLVPCMRTVELGPLNHPTKGSRSDFETDPTGYPASSGCLPFFQGLFPLALQVMSPTPWQGWRGCGRSGA